MVVAAVPVSIVTFPELPEVVVVPELITIAPEAALVTFPVFNVRLFVAPVVEMVRAAPAVRVVPNPVMVFALNSRAVAEKLNSSTAFT